MNDNNVFDLTVEALRNKGLNSDEILKVLSNLFHYTNNKVILQEGSASNVSTDMKLEIAIRNILLDLGMPCSIRGYRYVVKAIMLYYKNDTQKITSELYPTVAKSFGTSTSSVYNGIHYAINTIWNHGNFNVLKDSSGNAIFKRCPKNSEFIVMVTEWLK